MGLHERFAPEKALDKTRREYVLIRYEEGKTYTWTAYNEHRALFNTHGGHESQHREYSTGSELYASINAAPGQEGESIALIGMWLRLHGITPATHNDPRRSCTIKTTMTYTLAATGDENAVARVDCGVWGCIVSYTDIVTGASTTGPKTVTTTATGTCPLKGAFWASENGVTAYIWNHVWTYDCEYNNSVPEQATASATISSISLTFNPVKTIPEPF